MEVRPASIQQVIRGREGQMVTIDNDVQGVANALHEIDHHLRLRYSEAGEYWVVYFKPDEGDEGDGYLLTTAQDLDHRLVKRVEEVYWKHRQPGYSVGEEMNANDAAADAEADRKFTEEAGELYEKLAHAMRKDLDVQSRIFVPRDV
jgi:hypothetical protein